MNNNVKFNSTIMKKYNMADKQNRDDCFYGGKNMNKYQEGTVFELYENDNKEYVIIKNVEIEKNIYLLVAPVYGEGKNLTFKYNEIILLKVNKDTDEMGFETDEKVVKKVVEMSLKV